MIVAASISALGFVGLASLTQVYGYRLGGTIAVPVLAVYTLKNAAMFPVFVLSTAIAYLGLRLLKQRTLVHGRDELVAAILIGSLVPLSILVTLGELVDDVFQSVVFIGSILPGLAAYNYHQLEPETRRWDALTALVLFGCLTVLGWLLVSPRLATTLGTLTPPALYAPTADVATLKGVVVETPRSPVVLPRVVMVGLFAVGVLVGEWIRSRYGVRTGVVTTALLAIYALADGWLVVLYVVLFAATFLAIQLVHRLTLLYGRVLVGIGAAVGVLAAVPAVWVLPITRGLSAYFVGILAGVNAYNCHVASRPERRLFVPLQLGSFVVLLLLARVPGAVLPRGFPRRFGVPEVAVGVAVVLACLLLVEWRTPSSPTDRTVLDASVRRAPDRDERGD